MTDGTGTQAGRPGVSLQRAVAPSPRRWVQAGPRRGLCRRDVCERPRSAARTARVGVASEPHADAGVTRTWCLVPGPGFS